MPKVVDAVLRVKVSENVVLVIVQAPLGVPMPVV